MRELGFKVMAALGVEKDELTPVFLLFLLSTGIGFFQISYEIGATTLFLDYFDEAMTSKSFLISGLLGLLLTFIYSKLQRVLSSSKLAIITLSTVTVLTLLLRATFEIFEIKYVVFSVFLLMGPLRILSLISFWGIAGRLFSIRQGKRLFGLVFSGQLLGIILLSAVVKQLLQLLVEIENLLIISGIAIFVAIIVQLITSHKFKNKIQESEQSHTTTKETKPNLSIIFKNNYVSMMAVFVILSMIVAFFIYFTFLSVSKQQYPDSIERAVFFSRFLMAVYVFSFIIRTFIHSKILKNYGLKVTLSVIPFILGFFVIGAVVIGTFWGYNISSPQFIFFFLIIALSRLLNVTLIEAIQIPTFEMIYQSLDKKIRFMVQAAIDGIVNELACILAGLVLTIFGLFSEFTIIHYSYVLTGIIVAWIIVAFRLYKEYHASLEKALTNTKAKPTVTNKYHFSNKLNKKLKSAKVREVISSIKLSEIIEPSDYENTLFQQLKHPLRAIRHFTLETISQELMLNAVPILKECVNIEEDAKLKEGMQETIHAFETFIQEGFQEYRISDLVSSVETFDRRLAVKLSGLKEDSDSVQFLIVLLRDIISRVRLDAIKTSKNIKRPELFSMLIDNFLIPQYSLAAANTIECFGEDALDTLEQTFHKSGIQQIYRIRIIKLFGKIGGPKALTFLLDKLTFPNRKIVISVIDALLKNNHTCTGKHREITKQLISVNAGITAWNITIIHNLEKTRYDEQLSKAMEYELKSSFVVIFKLLSLIYDKKTISYIKENIDSGESEKINYSIELMDIFLDEELKPILTALFEDISYSEKIKMLQDHYPIRDLKPRELLDDIINRDINYINRWTKACALINYKNLKKIILSDSLKAHLFNHDKLMREISGGIIYSHDKEMYESITTRINILAKRELDAVIIKKEHLPALEHIFNLKQVKQFKQFSDFEISQIAKNIGYKKLEDETVLFTSKDRTNIPMYIIQKGQVSLTIDDKIIHIFTAGDIIDQILFNESDNYIVRANEDTHVYILEKSERDILIFENEQFAELILQLHI